jgi:hypothetical protein
MVCPLYIDFTRECIKKFPSLVKFTTIQTCESEQYGDCPIYQVCMSDFNCEYMQSCAEQYNTKIPALFKIIYSNKEALKAASDIWTNYCLSQENSKNCAKYQLYSKGEKPPLTLMPDGLKIRPLDLILKRKHIIHPPE